MKKKLYEFVYSWVGDKGNMFMLLLILYNEKDYFLLCEKVIVLEVKKYLKNIVEGDIVCYEVFNILVF